MTSKIQYKFVSSIVYNLIEFEDASISIGEVKLKIATQ